MKVCNARVGNCVNVIYHEADFITASLRWHTAISSKLV